MRFRSVWFFSSLKNLAFSTQHSHLALSQMTTLAYSYYNAPFKCHLALVLEISSHQIINSKCLTHPTSSFISSTNLVCIKNATWYQISFAFFITTAFFVFGSCPTLGVYSSVTWNLFKSLSKYIFKKKPFSAIVKAWLVQ